MADRRLFSAAFHAGDNLSGGSHLRQHHQQRPQAPSNISDPLKDLQKLLNQLLVDGGGKSGAAEAEAEETGGSWRWGESGFPPVDHYLGQHRESRTQQQRKQPSDGIWLRRKHARNDRDHLVDSSGANAATEQLERQYMYPIGHGVSRGNHDHWFADNPPAPSGALPEGGSGGAHWRHRSDVGCEGTQIPVIDRRSGMERQRTNAAGRLIQQQKQRQNQHHRETARAIDRSAAVGQEICGLTTQSREAGYSPSRQQHQECWQTMASSVASVDRKQVPVSSRREATLRASAEQLDRVSRRDAAAATSGAALDVSSSAHRRCASDAADAGRRAAFGNVGRAAGEDYEAGGIDGGGGGDATDDVEGWVETGMSLWYRPDMSREQAVAALTPAQPGSFLVRDSQSRPGSYGIAIRVARPPAASDAASDAFRWREHQLQQQQLVRHFLIEPSGSGGVQLRGCANEPVFSSLLELILCHTRVSLSLPCRLRLPARARPTTLMGLEAGKCGQEEAERRGTTYKVLYFCTVDVPSAAPVSRAVSNAVSAVVRPGAPRPMGCRMRVSPRGVKLSGLGWHRDFRLAYAAQDCGTCGLDSDGRRFSDAGMQRESRLFGLLVRKYGLYGNQTACLVLGDLESTQSAAAIADFTNRCLGAGVWKQLGH